MLLAARINLAAIWPSIFELRSAKRASKSDLLRRLVCARAALARAASSEATRALIGWPKQQSPDELLITACVAQRAQQRPAAMQIETRLSACRFRCTFASRVSISESRNGAALLAKSRELLLKAEPN